MSSNSSEDLKKEIKLFYESRLPHIYLQTLLMTVGSFYLFQRCNIKIKQSFLIPTLIASPVFYYIGFKLYFNKTAYEKYVNSCQFLQNSQHFKRI